MLNKIAKKDPNMANLYHIKKQGDLWSSLCDEMLVEPTETF
jgi:hypothetical protein